MAVLFGPFIHDHAVCQDHGGLAGVALLGRDVAQSTVTMLGVVPAHEGLHPLARRREVCKACGRSEEHTSELQSRGHLVCRLLLEKKKNSRKRPTHGNKAAVTTHTIHDTRTRK